MLKQPISFRQGMPIDVCIDGANEHPKHWHDCIEIICILEGAARIQDSCFTCCLSRGDVYIFNCTDMHSIYPMNANTLILFMHIDLSYFKNYFEDIEIMTFICDSYLRKGEIEEQLKQLRYLLAMIYLEQNAKGSKAGNTARYYTKELLSYLIDNFQFFAYEKNEINSIDFKSPKKLKLRKQQMHRLHRLADYIYKHYTEPLTLEMLAKTEFLSPCYLSHFIKDGCGLNFVQLLSLARVEGAEKLLLDTDISIDAVAGECGFTSRKYLNLNFRKWYKCSPSEYRDINRKQPRKTPATNNKASFNLQGAQKKLLSFVYTTADQNDLPLFSELSPVELSQEKETMQRHAEILYISCEIAKLLQTGHQINNLSDFSRTEILKPTLHITDYAEYLTHILHELSGRATDEEEKMRIKKLAISLFRPY